MKTPKELLEEFWKNNSDYMKEKEETKELCRKFEKNHREKIEQERKLWESYVISDWNQEQSKIKFEYKT